MRYGQRSIWTDLWTGWWIFKFLLIECKVPKSQKNAVECVLVRIKKRMTMVTMTCEHDLWTLWTYEYFMEALGKTKMCSYAVLYLLYQIWVRMTEFLSCSYQCNQKWSKPWKPLHFILYCISSIWTAFSCLFDISKGKQISYVSV